MVQIKKGFICEINGKELKIFEWSKKLETFINSDEEPFKIGEIVSYSDDFVDFYDDVLPIFELFVEHDELFMNTIATTPNNLALPKTMKKYQGKVWSPWIQFIRDEHNVFADWESLEGMATVKYRKGGDEECFELVKVEAIPEGVKTVALAEAPWRQETLLRACNLLGQPRDLAVNGGTLNRNDIFTGVCVAVDVPNIMYDPKAKGSMRTASILWSWSLGQCRSIDQVQKEVGQWYSFTTNDKRKKGEMGMAHYYSLTACREKAIPPPLVTRVVGGELEIDTIFTFDQERMEPIESRELSDWDARRKKIYYNAQFNDLILGPVDITKEVCESLIKTVDAHRAQQTAERRKFLEHDAILVKVTVKLMPNWMSKYKVQGSSIFRVKEVIGMWYGVDGEEILMV